jgi:hypothetical protein
VWVRFSRHSPNWREDQYFHSPRQKTTGKKCRRGQWEGKKQLVRLTSGFVFSLANPKFYSHLASWRMVICTPVIRYKHSHKARRSAQGLDPWQRAAHMVQWIPLTRLPPIKRPFCLRTGRRNRGPWSQRTRYVSLQTEDTDYLNIIVFTLFFSLFQTLVPKLPHPSLPIDHPSLTTAWLIYTAAILHPPPNCPHTPTPLPIYPDPTTTLH